MNGTFFNNPGFPDEKGLNNGFSTLKLNTSKKVKVYATFPNGGEWQNRCFSGILENLNDEDLIISDPSNGNWYMIPIKFVDYFEFEEKMNL